jgi:hypothetical protein
VNKALIFQCQFLFLGDLLTSGSKELSQSGGEKLQYLQTILRFEKRDKRAFLIPTAKN